MPELFTFDLKQLVRVCLNDPDLRAEVMSALDEGPLPVRTPCAHVTEADRVWGAMLRSDRDKAPGDRGFLVRDGLGWVAGRLTEILKTAHDASTMSAEKVAEQLGMSPAELAEKLKPRG